jgi:hypothetical protein
MKSVMNTPTSFTHEKFFMNIKLALHMNISLTEIMVVYAGIEAKKHSAGLSVTLRLFLHKAC